MTVNIRFFGFFGIVVNICIDMVIKKIIDFDFEIVNIRVSPIRPLDL